MEVKLIQTKKGIEVKVGRSYLPGYFLSDVAAHKAANIYIAGIEEDKRARRRKKQKKD